MANAFAGLNVPSPLFKSTQTSLPPRVSRDDVESVLTVQVCKRDGRKRRRQRGDRRGLLERPVPVSHRDVDAACRRRGDDVGETVLVDVTDGNHGVGAPVLNIQGDPRLSRQRPLQGERARAWTGREVQGPARTNLSGSDERPCGMDLCIRHRAIALHGGAPAASKPTVTQAQPASAMHLRKKPSSLPSGRGRSRWIREHQASAFPADGDPCSRRIWRSRKRCGSVRIRADCETGRAREGLAGYEETTRPAGRRRMPAGTRGRRRRSAATAGRGGRGERARPARPHLARFSPAPARLIALPAC